MNIWRATAFLAGTVVLAIVLFWWIPERQMRGFTGDPLRISELKGEHRRTVAQIVGGILLLAGVAFSWQQQRATARQVQLLADGQISERFTRAIDQLDRQAPLPRRIGAVYSLERIARDSERDHWTIMEVLTAYLRRYAARPHSLPAAPTLLEADNEELRAIISVLSRRNWPESDRARLDLARTDLRGLSSDGSDFRCVVFSGCALDS